MKLISVIIACLLISGCAYFGDNFVLGSGSYEKEYYPDGKLKREKRECKSPISDVVNVNAVKSN